MWVISAVDEPATGAMVALGDVGTVLLAIAAGVGAVSKLLSPDDATEAVRSLISEVPARPIVIGLSLWEGGLALALVLAPSARTATALACLVTFVGLSVGLGVARYHGFTSGCGCFGRLEVGRWGELARNVFLVGLAGTVTATSWGESAFSISPQEAVAGAGASAVFFYAMFASDLVNAISGGA